MAPSNPVFLDFVRVVVGGDIDEVSRRLALDPALAAAASEVGATRQESSTFFFAPKHISPTKISTNSSNRKIPASVKQPSTAR